MSFHTFTIQNPPAFAQVEVGWYSTLRSLAKEAMEITRLLQRLHGGDRDAMESWSSPWCMTS